MATRTRTPKPAAETPEQPEQAADTTAPEIPADTEQPAPDTAPEPAAEGVTDSPDSGTGESRVDPKLVAPHPFNAPARSQPQPRNPEWEKLRASVAANGVMVAAKLVTRAAFLAARPNYADRIDDNAQYVAIYGHRRRAAAIETGRLLLFTVDDAVMENGGDLILLLEENYGRADFTELDEALLFARCIEEGGMSQHALGKRLGRSQTVISRRLALLKTIPEVQQALAASELKPTDAAVIGGQLPFGTKGKEAEKTPEREQEQRTALRLIQGGRDATAACTYVKTARETRAMAAAASVTIVDDPAKKFGDTYYKHRLDTPAQVEEARNNGTLNYAVNPLNGEPVPYTSAKKKPQPKPHEVREQDEAKARREAMDKRRAACAQLVKNPLPQKDLLFLFARHYHNGRAQMAGAAEAGKLAGKLWFKAALEPAFGEVEFIEQMQKNDERKTDLQAAWARAIASMELNASATYRKWNGEDIEYLELLQQRAGYEPTDWERDRLEQARQIEAAKQTANGEPAKATKATDSERQAS